MEASRSGLTRPDQVLGVLGGMGPVASAEFVLTVYGYATGSSEQEYPAVVLHSDPSIERRSNLIGGSADDVLEATRRGLRLLYQHGCTSVVVCCMTLHHVLADLPGPLRAGIASALDLLMDELASAAPGRQLMLSSTTARDLGLFHGHPGWPAASRSAVWPDEEDQAALQVAIWDIKENRGIGSGAAWLSRCLPKYGASSFAVGCSEAHVLAKRVELPDVSSIDPFDTLARAAVERTVHTLASEFADQATTTAGR
jgi:aspartate racemase